VNSKELGRDVESESENENENESMSTGQVILEAECSQLKETLDLMVVHVESAWAVTAQYEAQNVVRVGSGTATRKTPMVLVCEETVQDEA
jgi:uncharacterized protein (DUF111 family)